MRKKFKGFSLMELVIVIAIIGLLTAMLVPAWMSYIAKSRIKTQNNNAKVIFNAAQTAATKRKFQERITNVINVGSGDFYFYWDGSTGYSVGSDTVANPPVTVGDADFDAEFANEISSVFDNSEGTVYKIWIQNYIVRSVVSARSENDNFIGAYPTPLTEEEETHSVSDYPSSSIAH